MSTVSTSRAVNRRENTRKLREFHQPVLDELGVSDCVFMPKVFYFPPGKTEKYISYFPSEISKGEDIYMENCTSEDVPYDPQRKLYKWKFNPHYEEEYQKTEPAQTTGHVRYLVPVGELILVKTYQDGDIHKPETNLSTKNTISTIGEQLTLDDPDTDLPLDQLTIRDLAAILLKKPVSRKDWLNEIIKG